MQVINIFLQEYILSQEKFKKTEIFLWKYTFLLWLCLRVRSHFKFKDHSCSKN